MYKLLTITLFAAFAAGCAIQGTQSGQVRNTEPAPVRTGTWDDSHLGDPTFERETVDKSRSGAVVSRENTAPPVQQAGDLQRGLELQQQGNLREARLALTAALNQDLPSGQEAQALAALREINSKIFVSAAEGGDLKLYVVKNGDSLSRIAQVYGTTSEMLMRLNGIKQGDEKRLQVGETLKVLGGKFELVVRREKFCMDLLLDGAFIQRYEVGLGTGGTTPLGEFKVKNRIPKPADGSWPYGHEKHRLGTRWLGLDSADGHRGYGIHGCRPEEERLIPGECSQGCVRMRNTEVEEVFDIVPIGTRLVVVAR